MDYEWNYRKDDKINANTYPICSFGYVYSGDQKVNLLLFRWLSLRIEHKDLLNSIVVFWSILIDWLEMIIREWAKVTQSRLTILLNLKLVSCQKITTSSDYGRDSMMSLCWVISLRELFIYPKKMKMLRKKLHFY